MSDLSPFDTMTVAEYHVLIQGTLEARDITGTAAALKVMALYHPDEADRARRALLRGIALMTADSPTPDPSARAATSTTTGARDE